MHTHAWDTPTEQRPGIRDPEAAAAHDSRDRREGGEGAGTGTEVRILDSTCAHDMYWSSCLVVAMAVIACLELSFRPSLACVCATVLCW